MDPNGFKEGIEGGIPWISHGELPGNGFFKAMFVSEGLPFNVKITDITLHES